MFSVGTLWSSVAIVRSGRRTVRPFSRNPSNACGLVTSWTRWRSMYSRSGSSGAECTRWRSQTFSGSVFPIVPTPCRIPLCGISFLQYGKRIGCRGARQGRHDLAGSGRVADDVGRADVPHRPSPRHGASSRRGAGAAWSAPSGRRRTLRTRPRSRVARPGCGRAVSARRTGPTGARRTPHRHRRERAALRARGQRTGDASSRSSRHTACGGSSRRDRCCPSTSDRQGECCRARCPSRAGCRASASAKPASRRSAPRWSAPTVRRSLPCRSADRSNG